MKAYLLARLRERSTWAGMVTLFGVAGWVVSPEQAERVITAGIALAGLLAVLLPDTDAP